jgi:hypothetical protein
MQDVENEVDRALDYAAVMAVVMGMTALYNKLSR